MFTEIPDEEFAAAIDACAAEVLWEAGISAPPIDALAVADGLQLVVARDYAMPYRGRFVRLAEHDELGGGQGTIVVGAAERPEREKWAVAHEVGESVAYRVFERLGVAFEDSLPTAREQVANRLANSILLPRRWFAREGGECDWDLLVLKDRFCTASHELIARRMLDIRQPIVMTVCDHGRVTWRRSNATCRPPALLAEERDAWRACHSTGLPMDEFVDGETGIERIRAWAVHEPEWKREILRSEVAEVF